MWTEDLNFSSDGGRENRNAKDGVYHSYNSPFAAEKKKRKKINLIVATPKKSCPISIGDRRTNEYRCFSPTSLTLMFEKKGEKGKKEGPFGREEKNCIVCRTFTVLTIK